ncbi:MAG: DUF916 domain-containing protein [Pyrinomonadaceae bacterium]|nr:DUF916 domain-containing protein [Pyrinomonadaceae bacterium]
MKVRNTLSALLILCGLMIAACQSTTPQDAPRAANPGAPVGMMNASALPETGFKAQITLANPPVKLRSGQKETIQIKVKNASDAPWYARGGEINTNPDNRFYLAVGNRWLKAGGEQLVTNMDGRYGLPKNLKPGEEVEVPLQITAPKDPGEYILEVDMLQEQVAWFRDKGSATAKAKVSVVR